MMSDAFLDHEVVEDRRKCWSGRLNSPAENQFVILAEDGSRLAGFICAYGNSDPQWGSLIDNLHVAHTHRRLGIGAGLMLRASQCLTPRYGESGVFLWALEKNVGARSFYERIGGTNSGVELTKNSSGGAASSCRYTWRSPSALADAPRRFRGEETE